MLTSTFQDLIYESEGRYLRPHELQGLKDYVDDLPRRIAIYRRLQQQEATLLDKVVAKYKPMHPTLTRHHGAKAWERCHRDLSYVWKYACLAMLLNSEDYLRDKLLYWMETILKAFQMKGKCHTAYRIMIDTLPEILSPEDCAEIRPYLVLAHTTFMG